MKAVVPAAGEGTRMRPATHAIAKEILPVAGKPAIQHVVEEAIGAGIEEIAIVIAPDKGEIVEHFGVDGLLPDRVDLHFVTQTEPRGLGDAILQTEAFVRPDEAFALLYPDNLVLSESPAIGQLAALHERLDAPVSYVVEIEDEAIADYSAIDAEPVEPGLHHVNDLVEKPDPGEAPSNLAPIGRHVLTSRIFDALKETEPGHGGEIQLTDAMASRAREREHFGKELVGRRLDVGSPAGYVEANRQLGPKATKG